MIMFIFDIIIGGIIGKKSPNVPMIFVLSLLAGFTGSFCVNWFLSDVTNTISPDAGAASIIVGGIVFHPVIIIVTAFIARRKIKNDSD